MAKRISKIWLLIALALTGCSAPSVNISTPEPIKLDIDMRLDVYQHADPNTATAPSKPKITPAPSTSNAPNAAGETPQERQKNRAVEIQNFKNTRWIGEGHDGLLIIRHPLPEGDEGDYISKVVGQENLDRTRIMKAEAEVEKKPLAEIQSKYAEQWRNRAFAGEFIEVPQENGTFKLAQKPE